MNNKITLSGVARILSEKTGKPVRVCEEFLKSLFSMIGESLEKGETVKIKELGTFKITSVSARKSVDISSGEQNEIPPHNKIVFLPSKDLASAVNAPFEMFETVELSEQVLEDDLMNSEAEEDEISEGFIQGEMILEKEKAEEAQKEVERRAAEELAPALGVESEEEQNIKAEDDIEDQENEIAVGENSSNENSINSRNTNRTNIRSIIWGIVAGLIVILLGGGILWWINKDNLMPDTPLEVTSQDVSGGSPDSEKTAEEMMMAEENEMTNIESGEPSIVENVEDDIVAPTKPSDSEVKYDTIGQTRYLGTMAKEYYGNYHFWPYIYEENKKILGHPDRIRPGTKVVIPSLSKYGVDPNNPSDIEKAKKKGAEIYARYQ